MWMWTSMERQEKSVLVTYQERNKVLKVPEEGDLKVLEGEFRKVFKIESDAAWSLLFNDTTPTGENTLTWRKNVRCSTKTRSRLLSTL